jgi:hypothetical protein
MQISNFHDRYFDGIWIGPNKVVHLFLRNPARRQSFILRLAGVERLTLTDIKEGNIILELVVRGAEKVTQLDIAELYGVDADSPQCAALLKGATDRGLPVLELDASYGAQGLALFQTCDIVQREAQP